MSTYTPAQAVELSGFTIATLRYYERIGLLAPVERDPGGRRVFNDGDLEWLDVLRCLRDTGMPIATMRRYAELTLANDTGDAPSGASVDERLRILHEHAETVADQIGLLQRQQIHLREKIGYYETVRATLTEATTGQPQSA